MSCYEFFKCIDKYMIYEDLAEEKGISESSDVDCSFIKDIDSDKHSELMEVCKKFVYLAESINNKNICTSSNGNNDVDYLNYWLNKQIYKIETSNTCSKFFYQNLRSKNKEKTYLRNFSSNMYDIEEKEYNNMNTLYTLYKTYHEINNIINSSNTSKQEIIEKARKCVEEYKTVENMCHENESKFCETLNTFIKKYEEIDDLCKYTLEGWAKNKLPPLTDKKDTNIEKCITSADNAEGKLTQYTGEQEASENTTDIDIKNITIGTAATIGISFFSFIFYRFTSLGPWLSSRISKNENILENLGEEMNHFSHTSKHGHMDSVYTYNIAYNSV
ncbi:PIR Superfamily Protein [Plasmodium ovale wallikeri]|uniref:PIR Superfamily Protein n=1 Tax=Plasmodium ovale wallikeri TaxID=864142 RepID=A0A1A9A9M7_PLAOA|nr:PIR Superfamily Protein [Plasmodium ovale wallikeri]